MNRKLLSALRALVGQVTPGPLEARLEAVIDRATNDVLLAYAEELARGTTRKAATLRSAAARDLIKRGAQALLDDARSAA